MVGSGDTRAMLPLEAGEKSKPMRVQSALALASRMAWRSVQVAPGQAPPVSAVLRTVMVAV